MSTLESIRQKYRNGMPIMQICREENKNNWYKQKLTAKRVYKLLKAAFPEATLSYASVNRFVTKWRKAQKKIRALVILYGHQGLLTIFEYIGGVPVRIVFDNATGIGRVVCKVLEENPVSEQWPSRTCI